MKATITSVEQYGEKVRIFWNIDGYGDVSREYPFTIKKEEIINDIQIFIKTAQSTVDIVNQLQELVGMEI